MVYMKKRLSVHNLRRDGSSPDMDWMDALSLRKTNLHLQSNAYPEVQEIGRSSMRLQIQSEIIKIFDRII